MGAVDALGRPGRSGGGMAVRGQGGQAAAAQNGHLQAEPPAPRGSGWAWPAGRTASAVVGFTSLKHPGTSTARGPTWPDRGQPKAPCRSPRAAGCVASSPQEEDYPQACNKRVSTCGSRKKPCPLSFYNGEYAYLRKPREDTRLLHGTGTGSAPAGVAAPRLRVAPLCRVPQPNGWLDDSVQQRLISSRLRVTAGQVSMSYAVFRQDRPFTERRHRGLAAALVALPLHRSTPPALPEGSSRLGSAPPRPATSSPAQPGPARPSTPERREVVGLPRTVNKSRALT